MLGNVALDEHRGDLGVETDGEEHRCQVGGGGADHIGFGGDRQGVQVDDAVEDVLVVLPVHPVPEGAEVVPEVDRTGRLDAREDAGHSARLPTSP